MAEAKETLVHKVTLGSGKIVLLRDITLKHEEMAAQSVGDKAGDSSTLMAYFMQNEMLKQIVIKVNDHELTANDRETIDKFLDYGELIQVRKVVGKLTGENKAAEPKIEQVSFGA